MTRARGAGTVASLVVLASVLAVWCSGASPRAMARQDTPSSPVEIGAGPVREPSLTLVGRSVYGADTVTKIGYLTTVIGLESTLLFTDDPRSEQTARFTYAGEIPLSSSANRGDVTVFDGDGTLRIYFDDDAGAAWDDPDSFADGLPVAEMSIISRATLQRQAPGIGVVVGDAQLRQVTAEEFAIDGARYRFGQSGIEARLRTVGALLPGGEARETPALLVTMTGSISVVDRAAIPVIMGGPATPVP